MSVLKNKLILPVSGANSTSVNDRVLRVVSGSGGSTGGSWTISGLNVLGHTLSVSEMPSHDHGMNSAGSHSHSGSTSTDGEHSHYDPGGKANVQGGSGEYVLQGTNGKASTIGGNDVPASGAHNHSFTTNTAGSHSHTIYNTGGGNSHDHGISHNGNWRPAYADVIVCERSK